MRQAVALLLLSIGAAAAPACSTTDHAGRKSSASIDSHRSTAFDGGVARLVVLLARTDHPDEDQTFRSIIEHDLAKRNVPALVVTVSEATMAGPQPLQAAELDDKRRALRSMGPEGVLRIRTTKVVSDALRPQWRITIKYEAVLHLVSSGTVGERVWHAELEHSGPERTMDKRLQLAAECLMERLDAEGVLTGGTDGR